MNPMRITRLGAIGTLAAVVAASGVAAEARAQQVYYGRAPVAAARAADGDSLLKLVQTTTDGRKVLVEMRNGELVIATVDDKKVPADRVKIADGKVRITDPDGSVIFEMAVAPETRGGTTIYRIGEPAETAKFRVLGGGRGEGGGWVFGDAAEPPRVMMGVSLADPDRALRRHFDLQPGQATMLLSVYDGLPAAEAGLRSYDIVVGIDGKGAGPADLRSALRSAEPGDTLSLSVIQGGKHKDVTVRLRAHDSEQLSRAAAEFQAKMAAEGGELGFFDFNVIAPPAPAPPAPPPIRGMRSPSELRLGQEQLLQMEADARTRSEEARRRAEEVVREMQQRQRRAETGAQGGGGSGEQLERLEDRLERLERLLEKLADEQQTKRRGGGD